MVAALMPPEPAPWAAGVAPGGSAAAHWWLHDFRRTGVTALAQQGVLPHVADRILNHVGSTITGVAAIYQKCEFLTERAAALDQWAAYVLALAHAAGEVDAERLE